MFLKPSAIKLWTVWKHSDRFKTLSFNGYKLFSSLLFRFSGLKVISKSLETGLLKLEFKCASDWQSVRLGFRYATSSLLKNLIDYTKEAVVDVKVCAYKLKEFLSYPVKEGFISLFCLLTVMSSHFILSVNDNLPCCCFFGI